MQPSQQNMAMAIVAALANGISLPSTHRRTRVAKPPPPGDVKFADGTVRWCIVRCDEHGPYVCGKGIEKVRVLVTETGYEERR